MSFPVAVLIDAPSSSSQTGKDAPASIGVFSADVGSNQVLCDRYQHFAWVVFFPWLLTVNNPEKQNMLDTFVFLKFEKKRT